MDEQMFCFQCEQAAHCTACTGKAGVCGKSADTAAAQDRLTGALISYASQLIGEGRAPAPEQALLLMEGLFTTITNVNFDPQTVDQLTESIHAACPGIGFDYDMANLWHEPDEDIRSLKSFVLFSLRGMAAYNYHARVLGHIDPELIERMEVQKKRRLPRPLRAGLIAACVCLALVGTVGAVMVGFDFVGSFSQTGYTVYGELTRYPMSAFSQEFQELTTAPGISDVECRSVSELEALLGIDLYDNPVLDAADEQRSHRHILSRGADGTVEKIRMMNFYYFVPAGRSRTELGNGEPDSDLVDMVQVGLYTDLYTEYEQGELENDFYYPNRTTPDAMDREEYLTAQGLPVVILTFVSEDSEGDIRVSREAHFIYRGMRWCITCSPGRASSQEQAEQTLKDILDAFA